MNNPLLTIVMPAYNEEGCIREVVDQWVTFLRTRFPGETTRLIVVNDGSKDNTQAILDEIKPNYPELVPFHKPNGGHGKAAVTAYEQAIALQSQWVFQTDSDDQFEAEV